MLFVGLAGVLVMGTAAAYRLQSIRASNQPTAATARAELPTAVTPTPAATATSTDTETQVAMSNRTDTYRGQEPIHSLPKSVPTASSHPALQPAPSAVIETAPQPAPPVQPAVATDVHVVVYTTSWCPHCREAKAWMASRGISYEERDIEASTDNDVMLKEINPRGGVPTFDVDGDVMVGFSAGSLASLLQHAQARQAARSL
jgi:mycoredoxin